MDPLSVTSGIVGIVAFTIQMLKMASTMKDAMEHFKSGPKEARDLLERLNTLETVCELISVHSERKENPPGVSSPASLDIISKALSQCRTRMEDLAMMLSSMGIGPSQARHRNSTSETTSRLRLLLRKDKIRLMVQEIDQVISLLHFVVTVDMR